MPPKAFVNNKDILETADILGHAKDLCELGTEFFERFSSYLSQFTGIERPDYIKEKIIEFFNENTKMTLSLIELQLKIEDKSETNEEVE